MNVLMEATLLLSRSEADNRSTHQVCVRSSSARTSCLTSGTLFTKRLVFRASLRLSPAASCFALILRCLPRFGVLRGQQ